MDRQIAAGNRVVANFMQDREKKRLKQRIKFIKQNKSQYSSLATIKQKPRTNSVFFQKNQQIQKQNVVLFNRIASIIRKTPKIQCESATSLMKSRQTSFLWHRKIQSSLQQQNKIIQKRLLSQKPTINNKAFYHQRAKHMKYLKTMSKYPYILNKKVKTQADMNVFDDITLNNGELPPLSNVKGSSNYNYQSNSSIKQLFKHQSLDFTISIYSDLQSDICTFVIQSNQVEQQKYSLAMAKTQFIQYFEQSDYDYQKMIGNLRLNDDGQIVYLKDQSNKKINQTPKQQKQIFKFKAQSTAYTSSGFKTGFRSIKRNMISKNQNQYRGNSKTDRKISKKQITDNQNKQRKELDAFSQNKFADINIINKQK